MKTFGTDITADDIVDSLAFFDSWEDRYRYIIDLGKELPPMAEALQTEANQVKGCQSLVWLSEHLENDRLFFEADSNSHIVRGLLAVVLAAYNGKSPSEIQSFDIEHYFQELNLIKHLSPSRGNGLRSMVSRIRETAGRVASMA
ncbi:MAG: SufE family protein [Nitrincola lacisaponensis]|uniref:SufE family protein n=1 Tax=Nitrincola lacisaponensis TaxID=267850 RepID=UPI00391BC851